MLHINFLSAQILLTLATVFLADTCLAAADDPDQTVKYFLIPAVVKINVTFENQQFDSNGVDTCKSEGTGFIVDRKHVLTAKHVFDFNEGCGKAEVFATSQYENIDRHLSVVESIDDASLLVFDDGAEFDLNQTQHSIRPCALFVSPKSVFQETATRFGIASGRRSPNPIEVTIGTEINEFGHRAEIFDTPVVFGESGGPVVHSTQVVGMIRETVVGQNIISLITPSGIFYPLIEKHRISASASEVCNLVLYENILSLKAIRIDENRISVTVTLDPNVKKFPELEARLSRYVDAQLAQIAARERLVFNSHRSDPKAHDVFNEAIILDAAVPRYRFASKVKRIRKVDAIVETLNRFDPSGFQTFKEDFRVIPKTRLRKPKLKKRNLN